MLTASVFSVALSLIGAFGLGSFAGAFANHYFAQRRENAAERRAATGQDRDRLLELGNLADELKRELGGTRSVYIADGRKARWTQTERTRAKKLAAVLDERISAFRAAGRALHEEPVARRIAWTVELMDAAREALDEGEPSPSVELVITALRNLEKTIDAFVRRRPLPPNALQKAWQKERKPRVGADRSKSAFMRRVATSHKELRHERLGLMGSFLGTRPPIRPGAGRTRPRRRPPTVG